MNEIQSRLDTFYEESVEFLRAGYVEQNRYIYSMPQLLQAGLHRFNEDLALTRSWADRLLSLLEDARRRRAEVESLQDATEKRFEKACTKFLSDSETIVSKRLDASQRKIWASCHFEELEAECDRWIGLKAAIKSFIETTDERFKHLLNAKNDLRSQLWAVRLHGILGDLHQEGGDLEDETKSSFKRTGPDASPGDIVIADASIKLPPTAHLPLGDLPSFRKPTSL